MGGQTEHDCCKYWSILAQTSNDGGKTWTLPPVPQRVAFASPFKFSYPMVSDVDDMSGIVKHPSEPYFYCLRVNSFLENHIRPDLASKYQGLVACRTTDPLNASLWRCWDGKNFTMQYRDPYLYPTPTPEDNLPPILKLKTNVNWLGNIVWSDLLEAFVLVCSMKRYTLPSGDTKSGIVYLTSKDFIHWSDPNQLLEWDNANTQPGDVSGASNSPRAAIFEANISVAGRNFDRIGTSPHLFYQCYNGKPKKGVSHVNI